VRGQNEQKQWLLIIGVVFVAIVGVSTLFGENPLEQEFNWHNDNDYSPFKLNYIDVLDSLSSAAVDEIQVSKESLRQRASDMKDKYGQVIVSWCPARAYVIGMMNLLAAVHVRESIEELIEKIQEFEKVKS